MSFAFTQDQLETLRDIRYRRTPQLRVTTEADALDYVNDGWFCFLYSDRHAEIPTLWAVTAGSLS